MGFPPPFPSAYFVPSLPPTCLEVRKAPGIGQEEEDGEEGCGCILSRDCALTAELFYQQILGLKIAGISASEVGQRYQMSCWGWRG